MFMVNNKN